MRNRDQGLALPLNDRAVRASPYFLIGRLLDLTFLLAHIFTPFA